MYKPSISPPVLSISFVLAGPLVTVLPSDTVVDVLRTFRRKKISCAPILRNAGDKDFQLVDVVDISTFITNSFVQLGEKKFIENVDVLLRVTCDQLADFSAQNPTHTIPTSASIPDVLNLMKETGTYRLALMDTNEHLTQLVTQTNLVEFALLNLDRLQREPDKTIRELGLLPTAPVFTCSDALSTMEVLQEMRNRNVTAVPIVNKQGVMNGMMTVRHLKTLATDNVDNLFLSVSKFLQLITATYMTGNIDMTLRDLLRIMVVNTVHHLFFVDDNGGVYGVVTLTDLISWCFEER
ncbi:uncharacterized protein EV422DRAFT_363036 [Fimicolochytrium jonesii]|uniref:uncharacterized protein n=1 Tax=Fimicolochytrium jonesii TaxID=1396493 RepID=UPI0022FDB943|nr:uncharacterized protein EV422DRAFT_363036 [Fimicolochytrium jonesii]KAI8823636.1 hypothetical protein EV422DRAFT_363036 [Fimicolochytrium jonesii]